MSTFFKIMAIILLSAGQALAVTAIDGTVKAPNDETESSPRTGTINHIDCNSGILEVDGVAYLYSPSAKVIGSSGKPISSIHIQPGLRVEFHIQREGDAHRITEIHILEESK